MFKNLCGRSLGISGRQSELIELALSYGFKGLDLDVVEFHDAVKTHGMPHARRLLDSAKLKLGSFALPVAWNEDDATYRTELARLPELVALAAELGCTRAVTTVQPGDDQRPYHQNFEFHRQRLSEIVQMLALAKIQLGLAISAAGDARARHAFEFVRDYDALQMLMSLVPGNVGVVVDSWDLFASGGDLETLRKLNVAKIVAVNLADAPADADGQWLSIHRLLPGETGVVDNVAVLQTLAEIGYAGPITPAPHANRFKGMARDAIVRLVGQQLDQVWQGAGLGKNGQLSAVSSPPGRAQR